MVLLSHTIFQRFEKPSSKSERNLVRFSRDSLKQYFKFSLFDRNRDVDEEMTSFVFVFVFSGGWGPMRG